MLLLMLINILPIVGLWAALRERNRSAALLSLVIGLMGIVTVIPSRPLVELCLVSDAFAVATSETERQGLLAIAQTYLNSFSGTAWCIQTALFGLWGIITGFIMRRHPAFGPRLGWMGVIISSLALGFWIPTVGLLLLFANTIGAIIWMPLLARRLLRLGKAVHSGD